MAIINNILLVDDNKINQEVMLMILKQYGYCADTAKNGKEAVQKFLLGDYDIIFMDIQMPEMDGIEATKRIRANIMEKKVIIVAMTAYAIYGNKEYFLKAGMDYYLSKPVKPKDVMAIMNTITGEDNEKREIIKREENRNIPVDIEVMLDNFSNNEQMLKKTIDIIMGSYESKLDRINSAISSGNYEELERAAHSFKGSIGILSDKIYNLAFVLENAGRDRIESKDSNLLIFEQLKEEMETAKQYLKEHYYKK